MTYWLQAILKRTFDLVFYGKTAYSFVAETAKKTVKCFSTNGWWCENLRMIPSDWLSVMGSYLPV